MKKTLILCLIWTLNSHALSGAMETRIEKLYDNFMAHTSPSTVGTSLKKITDQINNQLQKKTLSKTRREVLMYL
jgi:hypothetical protein